MDQESHRIANMLVGNDADAATIEIAWFGSAFSFAEPALISITGADLQPAVNGVRVPMDRPIWIDANRTVQFQHVKNGCYGYLAVAGGFNTPQSLESRSTHVRSGLGGLNGRPLQNSDNVPIGAPTSLGRAISAVLKKNRSVSPAHSTDTKLPNAGPEHWRAANWFVDPGFVFEAVAGNAIQVVRGRHFRLLDASSQRRFWESEFTISQTSDRMGYRLDGPELHFVETVELLSAGVARGTIQLPPGGNPIALMADAASTGGYPNIAHIASVDFARLAQAQPGESIRFREIELAVAQRLIAERFHRFRQLTRAVAFRVASDVAS